MKSPSRLPVGMLFIAAALWGISIPVMKVLATEQRLLFPEAGSLSASLASLCMRFGLAGLAVAAAIRLSPARLDPGAQSHARRNELKHGIILGVITAVSMFLQVDGLNYTSASTAGFLIALYCVLVPVLAWAFGWRRFTLILLACCALVLVGLGVLTGASPRTLGLGRGEWENLGAALLFAAQILWVARLEPGTFDPDRLTVVLCLTVSALCACLLYWQHPGLETLPRIHASPRALGLTLFLALLGTAAPFVVMNRFQPKVDPVIAGFVYCIEPVATAFGALFLPELLARDPSLYPNEPLTARVCIGGAFILAANILLSRDRPAPEAHKPGEKAPS